MVNSGVNFLVNKMVNFAETGGASIPDSLEKAVGFMKKSTYYGVGVMTLVGGVSKELIPLKLLSEAQPNSMRGTAEGMYTLAAVITKGAFHLGVSVWDAGKGAAEFLGENGLNIATEMGTLALGGAGMALGVSALKTWESANSNDNAINKRRLKTQAVLKGVVAAGFTFGAMAVNKIETSQGYGNSTMYNYSY